MSDVRLIDAIPILKALNKRYRELNGIGNNPIMHISVGARIDQIEEVIKLFEQAPILDYAPVIHGRWIDEGNGIIVCSECGEEHSWDEYRPTYCEDCGAKMDGGEPDGPESN